MVGLNENEDKKLVSPEPPNKFGFAIPTTQNRDGFF
jgi:hypothetical protein